ncbi:MAG: hypothetical protein EXR98_13675 [Gemmataceae bacterium]|nr:hypothetical protein [Gemmataceae bacterium]
MYKVDWAESAMHELTRLWLQANAELRKTITAATHTIDTDLRDHPNESGESRDHGNRIYFASPLCVTFRVEESSKTSVVTTVWLMRPRKKR